MKETSFILSSDPTQGALNVSPDGSYFEVQLNDGGLQIPKDATECYLSVVEANAWWTIPNVIAGVNDKVYIGGPNNEQELTDAQLGMPVNSVTFAGADNSLAINVPSGYITNTIVAGDIISIPSTNQQYPVTRVVQQVGNNLFVKTSNTTAIPAGTTHWTRIRSDQVEEKTNTQLNLPTMSISFAGDTNSIGLALPNNNYVNGTIALGDTLYIPSNGQQYKITQVVQENNDFAFFKTSNPSAFDATNSFVRLRRIASGVTNYEITLTPGLYDLSTLSNAISTQLESDGANPDIVSFISDPATQRVLIRFAYPSSSIDFSQPNTIRELIGFNANVYGNYPDAPKTIMAENVAFFNSTEYLLLNTDLTNTGIRFNATLQQTVAQVLIDVSPGSQILYRPFNPTKIPVPELIGSVRTRIRVWLTNNSNQRVDTNSEYYSMRVKLEWN
jgi:hypothetical protein